MIDLRIGPHLIAIEADGPPSDGIRPAWLPFVDHSRRRPDLQIRIRGSAPDDSDSAQVVSTHQCHWRLLRQDAGWRLEFLEQVHFAPKHVIVLDNSLQEADLYTMPSARHRWKLPTDGWHLADIVMPFLQWWLTTWSSLHGIGLILHASAVVWHDLGFAFAGPSGSGKTTIGHLLQDHASAHLLNDERVYLWRDASGWSVTGTPWHGSHPVTSARCAPLARLSVLSQAMVNQWRPLSQGTLLSRLLPEAFLPRWDAEAMEGLLETAASLLRDVPCGELRFTKDAQVVAYLDGLPASIPEPASVRT